MRRLWIPLVILVVVGAGGLTVARLHGIFGSEKLLSYGDTKVEAKPFNPKHLRYEIFGPRGPSATSAISTPMVTPRMLTESVCRGHWSSR